MVYLSLDRQTFKEVQMQIEIKEDTQIEVMTRYSFDVRYSDDNSSCLAHLRQEAKSKDDSSKFYILVDGLGQFSCEGITSDEDKKIAHVQAYTLLFPYIQKMVETMASSAGSSPLMIKMAKMSPEDVVFEGQE